METRTPTPLVPISSYQRLLYERFDLGQHVIAADERHDLAPNGVSGSAMRCRA